MLRNPYIFTTFACMAGQTISPRWVEGPRAVENGLPCPRLSTWVVFLSRCPSRLPPWPPPPFCVCETRYAHPSPKRPPAPPAHASRPPTSTSRHLVPASQPEAPPAAPAKRRQATSARVARSNPGCQPLLLGQRGG
jgi:hypothetical protein